MRTNIRSKREPGINPALTHTKHTKGYLLPDPIDLKQEMTMAAPIIVFIVYGMANPIRFRPKIRIAPATIPIKKAKAKPPMIVPTKRAGLPFDFPNIFAIALMFLLFVC
jgi:hypothetical protein